MSNPDTNVTNADYWIYDRPPMNESKKMLLLTKGGKVAILGDYASHKNVVIAWHGLPDRDKDLEHKLKL